MHNRQFVGCMRNLSVDGKNVDMAGFIANNGTREGTGGHQGVGAAAVAPGWTSAATQRSLLADPWGAVFFLEMYVCSGGQLLGWNPGSRLEMRISAVPASAVWGCLGTAGPGS